MLHLDTFRAYTLFGYRHVREGTGLRDWEHPFNAAWNAILSEVRLQRETLPDGSVLVLDGHMLLLEPRLVDLLDVCVYVKITKEECHRRRMQRKKPAPAGWDVEDYFESCIWASHVTQHAGAMACVGRKGMVVLEVDGTAPVSSLVERIDRCIEASRRRSGARL